MKHICLLLLLFPLYGNAQIEFKDIAGKWQEIKRTNKKDEPLDFRDTLRMEIRTDGFMMIRQANGPTITGEAELRGRKIVLEKEKMSIVEFNQDQLLLNDQAGTHHFNKITEFTNAPMKKVIPGIESGIVDMSMSMIEGKWTVYKKTDAAFNRAKFYLKSIYFKEDKGNMTYAGPASFNNNDSVYVTDALFLVKSDELEIKTGHDVLKTTVRKSDGEEMILESGSVHYFLKRFGKK